jgi:tripartite-type tricarboxylate transporter receptor subunit TctC
MIHLDRRDAIAAMLAPLFAGSSFAQAWPARPVIVKVAYPAGGPADVAARKLQPGLTSSLGQPVVIENLPGAGGSIATRNVLSAAPDGHTLLVCTGNDVILAPLTLSGAKYRLDALRLVANIFPADFVLLTNASHSFKGVDDLIAHSKTAAKELTVGTWGHGSAPHLVTEDFRMATGAKLMSVPYKGAAPVIQALLTGEIDAGFAPLAASVLNLIETGRVKAVGIANTRRNPFLPNVPTLNEGKTLRQFAYSAWAGIFVPTAVPEAVTARLSHELGELVLGAEFQKFLADSAALPVEKMTLAQAASWYKAESEKYTRVAKAIGLEPQ